MSQHIIAHVYWCFFCVRQGTQPLTERSSLIPTAPVEVCIAILPSACLCSRSSAGSEGSSHLPRVTLQTGSEHWIFIPDSKHGCRINFKIERAKGFPGDPVVKTPCSQYREAGVRSLVGELRSHMPHCTAPPKIEGIGTTPLEIWHPKRVRNS